MTINFAHAAYAIHGTCNVMIDFDGLMFFRQFVNEGLVTTVLRRYPLRANNKNVLQPSSPAQ